MDVHQKLIFL